MTENEWMMMFGENLKEIMHEKKLKQEDLADMMGVSQPTISSYINAQKIPGIRAIVNLSYALDESIDDLIDFGSRID